MKYEYIVKGRFINRLNRFVAEVEVFGGLHRAHIKTQADAANY